MSKENWIKNVTKLSSAKGYERNRLLRDCSYEAGMLIATRELERFTAIDKLFNSAIKSKLAPNNWIMKVIRLELDAGLASHNEVYERVG